MEKITKETQLKSRLDCFDEIARCTFVVSWIWHAMVNNGNTKVSERGKHVHSAVATLREIYEYPDLREKFIALAREADARRED